MVLNCRLALCLSVLLLSWAVPASAADHAVLFVGNSYTGYSSPNLAESYRQLVLEGVPQWADLSIESVTPGGRTLAEHYQQAGLLGTNLNAYFTNSNPDHMWDFVVLQDQSQIPSFPESEPMWQASRSAVINLDAQMEEVL